MSAAGQATLAGWMRVHIAIRNGLNADASDYARAAAKLTRWHQMQPTYASGEFAAYAVDFIPEGWAFTDPLQQRTAMARDTYFTLAHDRDALQAVLADLQQGPVQMRRINAANLHAATKSQDRAQADDDHVQGTDRLQLLAGEYQALLARLRAAREDNDARALSEGLKVVRRLAEQQQALQQELQRLQGYSDAVKIMVKELA